MPDPSNILLAFYGDDFTGSTDALEFIARAGAKAVLFTSPPTPEQLSRFEGLQVIGIAGKTRALEPRQMKEILVPAFEHLRNTGALHIHYKVCSTFDSSPSHGSIGTAIDCGALVFNNRVIPVLGGMPLLGRYCVFGNLFAKMAIGSAGDIYRLDRHPSMRHHPVTPATESDLRLHLGSQTGKKIGLIDVLQLEQDPNAWEKYINDDDDVVLLDALSEPHLSAIGRGLAGLQLQSGTPLFSVGSSGIEYALGIHWRNSGLLSASASWQEPGAANPLLVVSGSCSPVTQAQIEWAKSHGFAEIVTNIGINQAVLTEKVVALLRQGSDVIVHSGKRNETLLPAEVLGTMLGEIAYNVVKEGAVKRVLVAGGDTSSYAARAMNIEAVEMIAPLVPGGPLCRVHSSDAVVQGLEVNFKGGQLGAEDYFGLVKSGTKKV